MDKIAHKIEKAEADLNENGAMGGKNEKVGGEAFFFASPIKLSMMTVSPAGERQMDRREWFMSLGRVYRVR